MSYKTDGKDKKQYNCIISLDVIFDGKGCKFQFIHQPLLTGRDITILQILNPA